MWEEGAVKGGGGVCMCVTPPKGEREDNGVGGLRGTREFRDKRRGWGWGIMRAGF